MEYCRNGIAQLSAVIGPDRATALGRRSARLTGLQQYASLAAALGAVDGGPQDAARFLVAAFAGMGDAATLATDGETALLRQTGLRIARGIEGEARAALLACWTELWRGAVASHRAFIDVALDMGEADAPEPALTWRLSPKPGA